MIFEKIHSQRLTQLHDVLVSGDELPLEFDFRHYLRRGGCGTSGCAIGIAAIMWPEHLIAIDHNRTGNYDVRTPCGDEPLEFFGLKHDEYVHLFMPFGQQPSKYGGKTLCFSASRYDVAENIRAMLEYKAKECQPSDTQMADRD